MFWKQLRCVSVVRTCNQRDLQFCLCHVGFGTKCFKGTKQHTHTHTCTHALRPAVPAPTECCCFVSVLQMEVVSTFKRSGSFQGAVRRRSSVLSQLHDVNTISTPSHVALSTATANTSPAPGSESAERMYTHAHTQTHTCSHFLSQTQTHSHSLHKHTLCCTARGLQYFLLSMVVSPPARSLLVCVQCLLSSFLLFSPFKQHPVLTGCVVLVWSGLVQIQSRCQSRIRFVVECWSVQEAACRSLSVWGDLKEMEQSCL